MNNKTGVWAIILVLLSTIFIGVYLGGQTYILEYGEANVRFTDWSGWIVETRSHLLVFDYVELGTDTCAKVLDNGYITDDVLQNKRVRVFVSHIHGDHYQKLIWDWRNQTDDILYFIGWDIEQADDVIDMHSYRSNYSDQNMDVWVINKPNSPLSEVAYLVQVDGITVYHSGDLVTANPSMRPGYTANIDYISGITGSVDLAFIAKAGTWNDSHINALDIYTMKTMKPRIYFPSHAEKGGKRYIDFQLETMQRGFNQTIGVADHKGKQWFYSNGEITEVN